MRAAISVVVALTLALASTGAIAESSEPLESANACIKFWGEVRYGALGYNHLVHVANACSAAAECDVSTDVNPEVQRVTVAGRSEELVTTFLGSPARTFAPHVKCTMR